MRHILVIAFAVFSFIGVAPVEAGGARITVGGVGFATPESAEYYAAEDVYLISNINGSPFDADDNGFISKVSPTGKVLKLKWIDGARKDTTLHAPKGLAIMGGMLYVADRDQVHIFDLPSGEQQKSVTVGGATFLNGITPTNKGYVLVTDSALSAGFKPNGAVA